MVVAITPSIRLDENTINEYIYLTKKDFLLLYQPYPDVFAHSVKFIYFTREGIRRLDELINNGVVKKSINELTLQEKIKRLILLKKILSHNYRGILFMMAVGVGMNYIKNDDT